MFGALKETFWRLLPSSRSESAPVDRRRGSRKRQRDVSMDDEVDDADTAAASNSRKRFRADDTRLPSAGRSPGEVAADASESPALPLAQPSREQTTFWSLEQFQDSRSSGHASRPSLSSAERVTHGGPVGLNRNGGAGRSLSATAANPSQRAAWPLPCERPAFLPLKQSRNSRPSSPALRSSPLSAERVEQRGAVQNYSDGMRRSLFARPGVPLAQPSRKMELLQFVAWCRRYRPSDHIFVLGASQLSGERVEHSEPAQNRDDGLGNSRSATTADPSPMTALPLAQSPGEQTSLQPLERSQDSRPSGHASRLSLLLVERVEHSEPAQNRNDGLGNSRSTTTADPSPRPALPLARSSGEQTSLRPLEMSQDNRPSGHASRCSLLSAEHGEPVQNHNDGSGNSRSATAVGPSQTRALPLTQLSRGQTTFRPHEQSGYGGLSGRASRPFLSSVDLMGRGGPIQKHNEYGFPGLERARAVQPNRSLRRTPGHNPASSNEADGALPAQSSSSMTAGSNTRIRPQEEYTYQSLLPHQGASFPTVSTIRTNRTQAKSTWRPSGVRESLLLSRYENAPFSSVSTRSTSRTEAKSMWSLPGQQPAYATVASEPVMRDGPAFSSLVTNNISLTQCSVTPTILSQPISSRSSEPIPMGDPVTLDTSSLRDMLSPAISTAPVASPLLPLLHSSSFYSQKWSKDLERRLTYMDQYAASCILSKEQSYGYHNTHPVPKVKVPSIATFPNLTAEMEAAVDDAFRPDAHDEMIAFPLLTAEMEAVVSAAFSPGAPDEVLVTGFGLSITRKDVKTLKDLHCLNDEVINFYMNMLVERSHTQPTLPSVYAFHTFFYPKLCAKGYSAVKHWTRHVDIFAHDLLLVPVLLDLHWCLVVIDFRHKTINYYDPVGNEDYECSETLRGYLEEESRDKRQEQLHFFDWTLDSVKEIPYQMNFSDCGIFVLKCAEHITRDAKLMFNQLFMPYFRRCAVYEILAKKLL